MISFTTYFDENYLTKFKCLYDSLNKNCSDFHIYVVLLNDFEIIDQNLKSSSKITLINLNSIEFEYPELYLAKKNRKKIEYYFSLTPFIIQYVLNKFNLNELTYIDSDLYFFRNPNIVYDTYRKRNFNILLTSHGNSNVQKKYGKFNVGWIVFKNTDEVKKCLKEWSMDCIFWCFDIPYKDKFADQKYLDSWEKNYSKVIVVNDFLVNIGPWNFYRLKKENIDKLICFHFHNLNTFKKFFISNISNFMQLDKNKRELIKLIYKPYIYKSNEIKSLNNNFKGEKIRPTSIFSKILKLLKIFIIIKNIDIYRI